MRLKSYAKINLTLDVKGLLPNGYHEVEMIMQQLALGDDLDVEWEEEAGSGFNIKLSTNRKYLPNDRRNLAYKAAEIMHEMYGQGREGTLTIHIEKHIPVAAGLAGGSGNGAAVLHAINYLWGLGLDVYRLCEAGSKLGSDVPFCVMGQAAENEVLKDMFADDPMACHCALATGTGTDLKPMKGLNSYIVLSKPKISVSTPEVYKGIDAIEIPEHPDTLGMIKALEAEDKGYVAKNIVNVLENFTLRKYPIVMYTKNKMEDLCNNLGVLMSGSGPTVFAICDDKEHADRIWGEMIGVNEESYCTKTTF